MQVGDRVVHKTKTLNGTVTGANDTYVSYKAPCGGMYTSLREDLMVCQPKPESKPEKDQAYKYMVIDERDQVVSNWYQYEEDARSVAVNNCHTDGKLYVVKVVMVVTPVESEEVTYV